MLMYIVKVTFFSIVCALTQINNALLTAAVCDFKVALTHNWCCLFL